MGLPANSTIDKESQVAHRVVVTGMEAISPAGTGLAVSWKAASEGHACGSAITQFDVSRNKSQICASVPDFDPCEQQLTKAEIARMDRCTQFAVVAARTAIKHAGLDLPLANPEEVGVCIGTAIGGVDGMERVFRTVCAPTHDKPAMVSVKGNSVEHLFSRYHAHSVSHEVALAHGCNGLCTTMSTGCTAGLDAIGLAFDVIASGMQSVMITGASEAPITPIVVTAFDNIGCLTARNDAPRKASRPFDRDRDGFLLAEGCGILVLESEDHALARGARVLAYVLGYASLSNAYHMTSLPADGTALARTLMRTLQFSNVPPGDVDYVNAHGSSTQQNDRNETGAFKRVFGDQVRRIPISSTKSVFGHSLGAASALESVICVSAIQESVLPPTANYENPDPDCDLDYIPNEPRSRKVRVALCNASGFSGIHSAIVFGSSEYAERLKPASREMRW
jgi:3-oxoacyl-(acyl-carrier-protein) synthase